MMKFIHEVMLYNFSFPLKQVTIKNKPDGPTQVHGKLSCNEFHVRHTCVMSHHSCD